MPIPEQGGLALATRTTCEELFPSSRPVYQMNLNMQMKTIDNQEEFNYMITLATKEILYTGGAVGAKLGPW